MFIQGSPPETEHTIISISTYLAGKIVYLNREGINVYEYKEGNYIFFYRILF